MQSEIFNSEVIAVLIARVFLGLLFFIQGFDAVFGIRMKNVIETAAPPLLGKGVPKLFVVLGSYYTAYAQLIAGAFLVLGLFKYIALYLLGIDLILAGVVFGIITPVWDMRHVFPRLALLIFLLLTPAEWDVLSADYFFSPVDYIGLFKH